MEHVTDAILPRPLDERVHDMFSHSQVAIDFYSMLCGEFLGAGISRAVYRANHQRLQAHKGCVIKVEVDRGFQNVTEWQVWKTVQGTAHERWFCPCVAISACGQVLIQKEARDITAADRRARCLPSKVPIYFTDTKDDNWGMYRGRPVCRDYGYHRMLKTGMSTRMSKAVPW